MRTPTSLSRTAVDVLVVLGHLIAVSSVYLSDPDFVDTTAGSLILALEIITMLFHCTYVALYVFDNERINEWQHLKWLEYAISATLGTLAVAYIAAGDTVIPSNVIILLIAAGVAQQIQGYQLEKSTEEVLNSPIKLGFLSAFLLQIGEFVVVGSIINDSVGTGSTEWIAYSGYVIGYTLFGGIMAVVLWGDPSKAHTEKLYSYAGLFSKLAVFLGDYAAHKESAEAAIAVTTVMGFAFVCIMYSVLYAPTAAETSSGYRSYE